MKITGETSVGKILGYSSSVKKTDEIIFKYAFENIDETLRSEFLLLWGQVKILNFINKKRLSETEVLHVCERTKKCLLEGMRYDPTSKNPVKIKNI